MSTTPNTTQAVATVKNEITKQVLDKINLFQKSGELILPENYSAENALKSAMLILDETTNKEGKPVLDVCSKPSIANSLLKMVVWGLSPMKKQVYFIAYGDKLSCVPDYTGNIAMAKRYAKMTNIKSNCIHKGDDFEFEIDINTGRKKIIKHKQTLESIGSKEILGAYAVYEMHDGTIDVEIMNIQQIKDAWNQGPMKGNSPAHRNFPDRMARKTVINRACDQLIRSSDDKALYESEDEKDLIDVVAENVNHEVKTNANTQTLDFSEEVAQTTEFEVVDEKVVDGSENATKAEIQPKVDPGF